MTPEGELKAEVNEYLRDSGRFFLRMQSGRVKVKRGVMHLCPEGTADYLVCCPDPRWIELKAPGAKTKKERAEKQQEFADRVIALGHKHLTAETLDEVIDFVK
jgi:hypothetical protein